MKTNSKSMSVKEQYLQSIRDATDKLGRPPTYDEYEEMAGPCSATIENNFGSWSNAKRKAGVSKKREEGKPAVNESYFSEIDSTEKAYWLGMMYADGSVYEKDGELSQVFLGLKDREHVVLFRDTLDAGYRVRRRDDGGNELTITSREMANDLSKLGCGNEKTFSATLPELDHDEFRAAFVRGLYDGDGSLNDYNTFRICGANGERLSKVLEWIPSSGYVGKTSSGRGNPLFNINVRQKHNVEMLWSWLYPEAEETTPALERKMPNFDNQ
jgi:hypothetical protein